LAGGETVPDRSTDQDTNRPPIGLCAHCEHVDRITSERGSTFYLCTLSLTNQRFPKYPTLPVVACEGYAPPASSR
jgi:hypothetical protein